VVLGHLRDLRLDARVRERARDDVLARGRAGGVDQHQRVAREVGEGDRPAGRERMAGGEGGEERILEQLVDVQPGMIGVRAEAALLRDRDLDLAAANELDRGDRELDRQRHLDAGPVAAK
jgi:hypothetical protein